MKLALALFLPLVASLAGFAYLSDQRDINNCPKVAPYTTYRMKRPVSCDELRPEFNAELRSQIASIDSQLPIQAN
jgi:hypothetical protein